MAVTFLAAENITAGAVVTADEWGALRLAAIGDPGPFWQALKDTAVGKFVPVTTWSDADPITP
jgi:hypothetical protein